MMVLKKWSVESYILELVCGVWGVQGCGNWRHWGWNEYEGKPAWGWDENLWTKSSQAAALALIFLPEADASDSPQLCSTTCCELRLRVYVCSTFVVVCVKVSDYPAIHDFPHSHRIPWTEGSAVRWAEAELRQFSDVTSRRSCIRAREHLRKRDTEGRGRGTQGTWGTPKDTKVKISAQALICLLLTGCRLWLYTHFYN